MKTSLFQWRPGVLFAALLALQLLLISGCKKSEEPTTPGGGTTGDLLPLVVGHYWSYIVYELDANNNHVAGTETYSSTKVAAQVTFAGRSAYMLIDSTFNHQNQFESADTILVSKDANGDLSLYFAMQPPEGLPITFPSGWFPFIRFSAGTGVEYTIVMVDTTISQQGVSLHFLFKLTGLVSGQEQVQTPAGTFNATKFRLRNAVTVTMGGQTVYSQTEDTYMYFASGVGPVRNYTPSTTSATGELQAGNDALLRYKNF